MVILSENSLEALDTQPVELRKKLIDLLSYGGDPSIKRVVSDEVFNLTLKSLQKDFDTPIEESYLGEGE